MWYKEHISDIKEELLRLGKNVRKTKIKLLYLDLIETVWVFPRTAIVGIRINAKGLHGSGLSLK